MNTKVTKTKLEIFAANVEEINPLPCLKDLLEDKEFDVDNTLTEDEKYLFAKKTGKKVLPYLVQNRYTRNRTKQQLETVTMENDNLIAVFLPTYGGRLYSLYNKKTKKELLFKNSVIQPGNLAIRDAWIAGGIEWNIGLIGHSVTTSDTTFFSVLKDDNGDEFIRLHEFERHNRLFWQVDIHLPKDSEELCCYIRIINKNPEDAHLYWWTNVAIPLTDDTRVFSNSSEIFYIKPLDKATNKSYYGHATLPHVKAMSEEDVTYPENIKFSSEYFFQNGKDIQVPWESAIEKDGHMFYEASTQPLRIRKMFTWGKLKGGENWQDFLSVENQGKYLEVQAGLAPSQLHGYIIGKNSEISFTQVFGGMFVDKDVDYVNTNYQEACKSIENVVYEKINTERLLQMNEQFALYKDVKPTTVLYRGTEFGALELEKNKVIASEGLPFDNNTNNIWFELLKNGKFPECDENTMPTSYMTDETWKDTFKELEQKEEHNWAFWYYNSIFLYENDQLNQAYKAIEQSLAIKNTAWANYVKGLLLEKSEKKEESIPCFEKAYEMGNQIFAGFSETLSDAYLADENYQKVYDLYQKEKENDLTKRLLLNGAKAGLEIGDLSVAELLYKAQIPSTREGESIYTSMWYEYMAKKHAKEENIEYNQELLEKMKQELIIPKYIDFRMNPA